MHDLMRLVDDLVRLIVRLGEMMLSGVGTAAVSLREQMTELGIPAQVQTIVLVLLAVAIVLLAVRLLGGVLRLAVIVVLVILAIQLTLPAIMNAPH